MLPEKKFYFSDAFTGLYIISNTSMADYTDLSLVFCKTVSKWQNRNS